MSYFLGVGAQFPDFEKKAVVSIEPGKEFITLTNDFANEDGRWTVIFWWPKDFTFVCPTELVEFNNIVKGLQDRNVKLIGASTDTEFVHLAWRTHDLKLSNLQYPMLADTSKSLAEELGILTDGDRVAYRATYIVDDQNIIRWVSVNDLSVGRNVAEVVRVLDALKTGELCPANWQKGEATLS